MPTVPKQKGIGVDVLKTDRTRVRRRPHRGNYDPEAVFALLDEALTCHVAFAQDGQPYAIPMLHARVESVLYVHGSIASRTMRLGSGETPVCLTVTILDGIVLARSAFHHSLNYRSAVVLGTPRAVTGGEKMRALEAITEHVLPGRWSEVRQPSALELKATSVFAMPLDEASMKIRTGPPGDDAGDLELDVWAGVIPLSLHAGRAIADPLLRAGIPMPATVRDYARGGTPPAGGDES
jgi:uncharacterized protein